MINITCLCCKEICKEAKVHDFMNDNFQHYAIQKIYPKKTQGTFCGSVYDLAGICCVECYLAIKKFEFEWELAKMEAEHKYERDYERSKEERCCSNC